MVWVGGKMKMTGCRVERGRALRGLKEICTHQALDLEGTRHADSLVAPQLRRDVAEACPVSYTHLTLPTILRV